MPRLCCPHLVNTQSDQLSGDNGKDRDIEVKKKKKDMLTACLQCTLEYRQGLIPSVK